MAPKTPCNPRVAPPKPKPKISIAINTGAKKQGESEPPVAEAAPGPNDTPLEPDPTASTGPGLPKTPIDSDQTPVTQHKRKSPSFHITEMAEPPSKRAKRTDSSALWDKSDGTPRDRDRDTREPVRKAPERERNGDGGRRGGGRDERRHRSRSRDRPERRRDRSRSREKIRDRDGHGRRDRDMSRSRDRDRERDRNGTRRGQSNRSHYQETTETSTDHVSTKSDRHRDRSRSPIRNGTNIRTRSPPKGPKFDRTRHERHTDEGKDVRPRGDTKPSPTHQESTADPMEVEQKEAPDEDAETALLRKMMGFSTFKSTQNTKVPGNNVYGVRKEKKTEYRQYMNRVGGFNRPLSPSR